MPEKVKTIPVNAIADEFGAGVTILKASVESLASIEGLEHAHRHDAHLFSSCWKGVPLRWKLTFKYIKLI